MFCGGDISVTYMTRHADNANFFSFCGAAHSWMENEMSGFILLQLLREQAKKNVAPKTVKYQQIIESCGF